ncbi:MAG: zinc ribbon domain-containing protein, partial [Clostridia bacterium]|nr:zinc ribbon domain-containing protein [Clostridia bacterium]
MKCPYCNNNLNIEDKYCPYCGKENKFAKEHQESMEHYEADYTATKQDVIAETKRFQTKTIRITILAVMAAIAAGFFILAMSADDISYSRREKAVIAKSAHHKAAINALMEDRDYLAVNE